MKIQSTSNHKLQKVHLAVVGEAKSGKTHLIKTIKGKVLMLNSDKGHLTLKDSDIKFVEVNDWETVVEFMRYIKSPAFSKAGFDWVVIDSVSTVADILLRHLGEQGVEGYKVWEQYKLSIGGMLTTLRDSTIFNSLSIFEKTTKESEDGVHEKKIGIQGSLQEKIPYIFSSILVTQRKEVKGGDPQYLIQTCKKGGWSFCGTRGKLNDFEPANLNHIVKKLLGGK